MTSSSCSYQREWRGLYSKNYDLVTSESYAHPAKASWDLAFKILDHLKELGLLTADSVVLDPMAGTGRFNIVACAQGLKSISVELEPKFVAMMEENKKYASKKLNKELDWKIIQGDSRHLSELLQERGLVSLMSPPYGDQIIKDGQRLASNPDIHWKEWERGTGYSNNPNNIGNLPDHPLVTIMSPPWEAQSGGLTPPNADLALLKRHRGGIQQGLGQTEGQIQNEEGETYLSEMSKIYQQLALCCSVLVVVVKCPTRAGKLRRLDLDTIASLEATNWKIHCIHRSILFEELETKDLFGEKHKKVKGRMSFFKRLSWQKGKSEIARWEDVIFAVREGEGMISVMSPPYHTDMDGFPSSKSPDGKSNVFMEVKDRLGKPSRKEGYGSTPGQIGRLK